MAMEYRRLGRAGLRVSVLSFGSWVTFGPQLDVDRATECLDAAHRGGVNFFDNAEAYAGGESWASFMDRARAALRSLADAHPGETVVAAVHGGVIEASFREAGLFDPGGPDQALRPDNTGLTIWSRPADGGAWRLERYNDVAHLD